MTNKIEKFSFFSGFGNIREIGGKDVKYQEPITLYDFTIKMDEFEKFEKTFGMKELKKSLRYDFSRRCAKNLLEMYKQYKCRK